MGDSRPPPLPVPTLSMTDIIPTPETGQFSGAYPHGTLDQYNAAELDQIDKVQHAGQIIDEAQHGFQCEVIRLKLLLDGQDQSDGITKANQHQSTRFWDGAKAGHFGKRIKEIARDGQRGTVQRWIIANEAASILLGEHVSQDTCNLPFELAREKGMSQTALCTYMRLFPKAREMATHYFNVTREFRSDMLQEFEQVIREFPEHTEFVLNAITNKTLTFPSHFKEQKAEWRAQAREREAAQRALEQAAQLADAENKEEEADNYEPSTNAEVTPENSNSVAVRRTRPRSWWKSKKATLKVEEIVCNLDKPLPNLIDGLAGLNRSLKDQFAISSHMVDYAEFWAGYDRFFYSERTHQAKWGRKGRLERMKQLRKSMLEVAGKLDAYISATEPPENIEYPEG